MKTLKQLYGYFTAIMYAPRQAKNRQLAPIIAGVIVLIFGVQFAGMDTFNYGAAIPLAYVAGLLFLCGAVVSACINCKPNVATLMPLGRKKRLVFTFVSPLILCILILLFVLALIVVGGFIFLSLSTIFNGPLDFNYILEEEIRHTMDMYSGIFVAAYFIIMYSGSMLAGFIQSRKRRNWYMVGFLLSLFVGIILTGMTYYQCNPVRFVASPFVSKCYKDMQFPWLCVTAWCVIAFALLGTAIYFGIKKSKQNY